MKHFGRPIFADYLVKINSPPRSDAIIAVFITGEVFLIPIDDNRQNYLINPYTETAKWFEPTINSSSQESEFLKRFYLVPHLAHVSGVKPNCIGSIKFSKNVEPLKIEFTNDGSNLLIVYGLQHKDIPSIGVFKVTSTKMSLVYADSLLSVADITYSSHNHALILIPRLSQTSVGILEIPQAPRKYQPRLIPEMMFAGSHLRRTVHLSPGGSNKWHLLSWSDEICPSIIAWHFSSPTEKEKLWSACVIDILLPCYLQFLSYDQTSDKLGFIVQKNDDTLVCVWDLENKHIIQYNYKIPGIDQIWSAKWAKSVSSSSVFFTVSASTGYYEHQIDKIVKWPNPIDKMAKFFTDEQENRFYFDDQGELKVVSAPVFKEQVKLENVEAQQVASYPIIQNYMNGKCDTLSCMHLYRCANCRRPLLCPLVSRSTEHRLSNCYCSAECQLNHWPTYVAIHQPISLPIEIDNI
ncbi:hypothetical protein TRFO_25159 [Tritrichomonas foetus]|uniref:Uncharacterized protein n=1 Tax=Tritrichomonas foetus TaxID=1144522 RepID=A0A1J4KAI3_9EUKA|nr:hypothetical protein TRFO_25159 [Tritrichomonas foetus]|eukprot:OHT06700.1 hypothetical protein TRFO_25159 [Tritrichomonas foetus]